MCASKCLDKALCRMAAHLAIISFALLLSSCGKGTETPNLRFGFNTGGGGGGAVLAVTITPPDTNLLAGGAQTFTAAVLVTGGASTAVTWSVQEGATGGAVTTAGVYTAPAISGTFHVVATSQADPTMSAKATVTVVPFRSAFRNLSSAMGSPRFFHTATLLQDGKVLIAGGSSSADTNGLPTTALATAEVYDQATRKITATGSMNTPRFYHTATLLQSGKVLIAGGQNSTGTLDTAELFNPAFGKFSTVSAPMSTPRTFHTATLLPNGQVLISGGSSSPDTAPVAVATAQLFDPTNNSFSTDISMINSRFDHTATLLADGTVLLAGGIGNGGVFPFPQIYTPVTNGITQLLTPLLTPRHQHTATSLADGRVLIAGGVGNNLTFLAAAEIYSGFFTATGSMNSGRSGHTATLLLDGTVLITGGEAAAGTFLSSAELFDPTAPGLFSPITQPMGAARARHTATRLDSGRVFVTGGINVLSTGGSNALNSAELFE